MLLIYNSPLMCLIKLTEAKIFIQKDQDKKRHDENKSKQKITCKNEMHVIFRHRIGSSPLRVSIVSFEALYLRHYALLRSQLLLIAQTTLALEL